MMKSKPKTALLICLAMLWSISVSSQNANSYFGYPLIQNFNTSAYHAHSQNFDICQDNRGIIYVGNFAGILEYDGTNWRHIATKNATRISTVTKSEAGRIYVGGYQEFGYLKADPTGRLQFEDLTSTIDQPFDMILSIFENNQNEIFIVSNRFVAKYKNLELQSILKFNNEALSAFLFNNTALIQMKEKGLFLLEKNKLKQLTNSTIFSGAINLTGILHFNDHVIMSSDKGGIFFYENDSIIRPEIGIQQSLIESGISSMLRSDETHLVLGTFNSGIIVLNDKFEIQRKISKNSTLQNQYIRALYIDHQHNLWAALDRGISVIKIYSPVSYTNSIQGLSGTVNDLTSYNGTLYIASSSGAWQLNNNHLDQIKDFDFSCRSVFPLSNTIILSGTKGTFELTQSNNLQVISTDFPIKSFVDRSKENAIWIAYSEKLEHYEKTDNRWINTLTIDQPEGEFWDGISTVSNQLYIMTVKNGLYKLSDDQKWKHIDYIQELQHSIGNELALINDHVCILSTIGVFEIKADKITKAPKSFGKDIIDGWWNDVQATDNGYYAIYGTGKGLYSSNSKVTAALAELNEFDATSIVDDASGIWIGGPNGLACFNYFATLPKEQNHSVVYRQILLGNDSIFNNGAFSRAGGIAELFQDEEVSPKFKHNQNAVAFSYSASNYIPGSSIRYSYYLEGYDKHWSVWGKVTHKEYTNLKPGVYTFRVKAQDASGTTSKIASYKFTITKPWYSKTWAIILFIVAGIGIILFIIRLRYQQLLKEKEQLENIIKERTQEVVEKKEEIENQAEELHAKNEELQKINLIVKAINAEIKFDRMLSSILEKTQMLSAVDRATAWIVHSDNEVVNAVAGVGLDSNILPELSLETNEFNKIFIENAEEIYYDIFYQSKVDHETYLKTFKELGKTKSLVCISVIIEEKTEGYILLENLHLESGFSESDMSLIKNLKEHIISAFIKTKILQDLEKTLNNLKETQTQLVQQEKLASLGQLTAGIAHEIQNPLNFVNNFSNLTVDLADELHEILDEVKDKLDEDTYDDLEDVIGMIEGNAKKINDHGQRASRIVKGMLQHSRGDSGDLMPTNINRMVEEYINLGYHGVRAENKSFNTGIKFDFDESIKEIRVVPQDLSRVVLNMMNNACYAVNEKSEELGESYHPEIYAGTKLVNDYVVITIRDNGKGMPESVKQKIFNPFFTTKPTGKGTGLGLSMSYDIISQIHKGKLEVDSAANEFTEFRISIPTNL